MDRLWRAGDDPEQLLDPGRLLDLEASLYRAERRFGDALAALKLFQDAASHERATADLGRRLLRYLFKARYDEGLRFGEA